MPPPEVTVAQESVAPTITTQQAVPAPEPPKFTPPAPPAPAPAPKAEAPPTPATPKGRGNIISREDYPEASLRGDGEQGVTRVSYVVGVDGKVSSCETVKSSGFPRLDEQACKLIIRRFRFNPATRDGVPVPETKQQPIRWSLEDK